MKTVQLFHRQGLLLDGLTGLFARSQEFELIRREQTLDDLPSCLHGIPPNFIIIGSGLLHSASACRSCMHTIGQCTTDPVSDHILTVIMIERNDQVLLEHFHSLGFHGFVFEQGRFSELEQSLRALYHGAVYLPSFVAEQQSDGVYGRLPKRVLTQRETQVLQRISMGECSKEIATNLGIAVSTVDVYRKRLLTKLQLRSVAELTKYAVRMGLTAL
ncbi:MAG: response regulator transcription factor [Spirochaetia bacterium]|nr:response regulator transcription factor [Spirochaetia bacterium]MCF7941768.1 response regulator transcription factor [Spirochaetia bacterium]